MKDYSAPKWGHLDFQCEFLYVFVVYADFIVYICSSKTINTMKQTIIVTGGAGFIGHHLIKRLLNDGEHVMCVDNLSTGSYANIKTFTEKPNFRFVKHDIIETMRVEDDVKCIYNLACPASPKHYQKDAVHTLQTSVWGVYNLLELARAKDCPILQTSTSEIYGDPSVSVQAESYWGNVNPIGVRSCYDEGKRCAETLCMDFHRQYGTKVKIVRIFNTYGPNMSCTDGRVIPNFIKQALQDKDLTVYGNGAQTRSFMYVDDLVDGLVRMMDTPSSVMGPVNLGNPNEMTVDRLADKIIMMTSSHSRKINFPLPSDDPQRRCPDINKAYKVLGWKPVIGIEEGLKNTIEYYKQSINNEES